MLIFFHFIVCLLEFPVDRLIDCLLGIETGEDVVDVEGRCTGASSVDILPGFLPCFVQFAHLQPRCSEGITCHFSNNSIFCLSRRILFQCSCIILLFTFLDEEMATLGG